MRKRTASNQEPVIEVIRQAVISVNRQQIADEYGELDTQYRLVKPMIERREKLAAEIRSWFEREPGGSEFLVHGARFQVQIGQKKKRRWISNMPKLFSLLGKAAFLGAAKVDLKTVDALVDKQHHPTFVREEQDGPRTIDVIPNARESELPKAA